MIKRNLLIIYLKPCHFLFSRSYGQDFRESSLLSRLPCTDQPDPLSNFLRGKSFNKKERKQKIDRF